MHLNQERAVGIKSCPIILCGVGPKPYSAVLSFMLVICRNKISKIVIWTFTVLLVTVHNSWHHVCGGCDSVGATVISFPRDTRSSSHIFGGHASLWRRETFHTTDFPVFATNFGYDGITPIFCHNLRSPGLLPFLRWSSRPALYHAAWQFCQHVCFAHNSKVSNETLLTKMFFTVS
jgi:hypothetical protein